jgi:hypothetical protein
MRKALVVPALLASLTAPLAAAELQPRTIAAFDRYVSATVARMADELRTGGPFLRVDSRPDAVRRAQLERLRAGQIVIDKLETRDGSARIDVPDGLIHHWVGIAFIPGASVDRAVALMQDYDRHADLFRPAVAASKILARDTDTFRVYLRFFMKKVISVTVNSEHDARFTRPAADRAYSQIVSTRIAEVEHAGTPREVEKPVGRDSGFIWRFNTYWRFLERDGGTYIQCESLTLSRDIPFGLGWMIGPFVTSIPRDSLTFTLQTLQKKLGGSGNLEPLNPLNP